MFIEKMGKKELERLQEDQRRAILEILRSRKVVSNDELYNMGFRRAAARVKELREMGHLIDTVHVKGKKFLYVYRGRVEKEVKPECTFHIIRDGQTRSKKSWAGEVEVASRIVGMSIQTEPMDTFVFARNVEKRGNLVIFALRDGKPEVLELKDSGESRKKIAELMKDCEFVVARRC